MPSQPLYEKFLKNKGLQQRIQKTEEFSENLAPKVNVLRISQNLQKNLLRESLVEGYSLQETDGNDVKLTNKDQLVDFGEYKTEELEENNEKSLNDKEDDEEMFVSDEEIQKEFRPVTIQAKPRETILSEDDDEKTGHQRANSAQTGYTKTITKPLPLQDLIFHSSDYTVKPIIGNREMEKPMDISYNPQNLGVKPLSSEEILGNSENNSLEDHFHGIYNSLTNQTTSADKLNLLNYFESIIINSTVANKLINSAFVSVFIKLLKSGRSAPLKVRICSIVGQMIRYATLVNPELSSSGLYQVLNEQLRDKNDKLRRKAMAALGEYLFYAATQMDENISAD